MANADPKRHIVATTIDVEGAAFARQYIEKASLLSQISIKMEDVAKLLLYADGYFDFIYARLVLHYLPKNDLVRALGELHRVLKRGGRLFVVVRSLDCLEAQGTGVKFDPESGMTTYVSNGHSYSRHFHTEASIQNYLSAAEFGIKHVKSYEEQLCIDFQRTQLSCHVDILIEVLATK